MPYSDNYEEEDKIRPCGLDWPRLGEVALVVREEVFSLEAASELQPEEWGDRPAQIQGSSRSCKCEALGMERSLVSSQLRDEAGVSVAEWKTGRIEEEEVRKQVPGQVSPGRHSVLAAMESIWEVLSRKSSLIWLVLKKITLYLGSTAGEEWRQGSSLDTGKQWKLDLGLWETNIDCLWPRIRRGENSAFFFGLESGQDFLKHGLDGSFEGSGLDIGWRPGCLEEKPIVLLAC